MVSLIKMFDIIYITFRFQKCLTQSSKLNLPVGPGQKDIPQLQDLNCLFVFNANLSSQLKLECGKSFWKGIQKAISAAVLF